MRGSSGRCGGDMAVHPVNGLAICAGVGAIELGLSLAIGDAYRTVGVVEQEARLASVWVARMDAKIVGRAAIWDDLTTFDGKPWRGCVDIISGGIPCQPFSVAGRRAGTDDERWIWKDAARVISEVEPRCVFIENVPGIIHAGLPEILSDLAALGFDAEWGTLSASDVGAPHVRNRFWLLAYTRRGGARWLQHIARSGWQSPNHGAIGEEMGNANCNGLSGTHVRCTDETESWERFAGRTGCAVANAESAGHQAGGSGLRDASALAVAASDGVDHMADAISDGTGDKPKPIGGSQRKSPHAHESAVVRQGHRKGGAEGTYTRYLFPPGPADADGWREYIRQGGPEPVVETPSQSRVLGGVDESADWLDRIHAAGNSVLPLAAAVAFTLLADRAIKHSEVQ